MQEIGILELWKILRKRWLLILSAAIGSLGVSGFLSFYVLKPEYEATTILLVQTPQTNNQVAYTELMANQKLIKTYTEILRSRKIADDVINRLNLGISNEQLLEKVKVRSANESLITTITVIDQDPRTAVAIANGFAQSFSANLNSIMKVDNVSILDEAKVSHILSPARPKPYFNMAVAFFLGMATGSAFAILLEALNKTVRTEKQVEELLGLPVLGVITKMDRKVRRNKRKPVVAAGGVQGEIQTIAGQTNLPV
ncbi:YveK family protein [Effusibacillus lacus]|uniref:Polysaccharide chain length determinant N-terminal domain-containing protein n=1 Tax=Effusibacillus lacus TaxID=1348429 RepID=A0A292YKE1_9BACL|nr:Wzz/FepE/Etk N-terminal domain-containing protein [Effusibacillus lacus]TCS70822.1 capsular polysaccharide biosynthesis protein [Effusibacillus lacus]GAX89381.1 hypothetical protein EFBL_0999 [Effusibacillus lacus]